MLSKVHRLLPRSFVPTHGRGGNASDGRQGAPRAAPFVAQFRVDVAGAVISAAAAAVSADNRPMRGGAAPDGGQRN